MTPIVRVALNWLSADLGCDVRDLYAAPLMGLGLFGCFALFVIGVVLWAK